MKIDRKLPDDGCKFADSCLNCPHTQCFEDIGEAAMNEEIKKSRIKAAFRSGKTTTQVSLDFNVSERTAQRWKSILASR